MPVSEIHKTLWRASKAMVRGHKKASQKLLLRALKTSKPNSKEWTSAALILAQQYFSAGNLVKAKHLSEMLAKSDEQTGSLNDQESSSVQSMLGEIYIKNGDTDRGIACLRKAMELDAKGNPPEFAWELPALLAEHLEKTGQWKEAIDVLQRALPNIEALPPPFEHRRLIAHRRLANIYLRNGDELSSKRMKQMYFDKEVDRALQTKRTFGPLTIPGDWGKDELTNFFGQSQKNVMTTFANKKDLHDKLARINAMFLVGRDCGRTMIMERIQKKFPNVHISKVTLDDEDWLEMFFYMGSHNLYDCSTTCFRGTNS